MTTVRNVPRRYDKPFLFLANAELLNEAKRVAAENEMSVAALLRQAVRRSIAAYGAQK